MNIGVDAVTVGESLLPAASGMRIYTTALVRAMAQLEPSNQLSVFESPYIDLYELDGIPNIERVRCVGVPRRRSVRVVYQNTAYPAILRRAGLDVFLATANVLPIGLGIPSVVVIQGLQWFTRRDAFGRFRGAYLRLAARDAARRSKQLVAVSEAARTDAIRYLGASPAKVAVIHHGVSEPMQNWRLRRTIPANSFEPFILSVATFYQHKNLFRLIDAYAIMRRNWGLKHRLRVVGGDADLTKADLLLRARAAGVERYIDLPGAVDHAEIATHYANAELFVYPSLYETFGHPPLEAMVAGCPVVAANSSAIPEIVGDAALLVDPTDVEAIAGAMGRVLTDGRLRRSLVSKGSRRVHDFSWSRAAESYLKLLEGARSRK